MCILILYYPRWQKIHNALGNKSGSKSAAETGFTYLFSSLCSIISPLSSSHSTPTTTKGNNKSFLLSKLIHRKLLLLPLCAQHRSEVILVHPQWKVTLNMPPSSNPASLYFNPRPTPRPNTTHHGQWLNKPLLSTQHHHHLFHKLPTGQSLGGLNTSSSSPSSLGAVLVRRRPSSLPCPLPLFPNDTICLATTTPEADKTFTRGNQWTPHNDRPPAALR